LAALLILAKIETMLPCNVIMQAAREGRFDVVGGCPSASVQVVRNPELVSFAEVVGGTLRKIVEGL
jgi:hypothetical protein